MASDRRFTDAPGWSRRAWLQGAVSVLGGPLLAGCGGGSGAASSTASPAPRSSLVAWVDHGPSAAGTTQAIPIVTSDVQPTPSRQGVADEAASFASQGALVTAALPDGLFAADWAVTLWLCSDASGPATVMELLRTDGSTALTLRWNDGSAIAVTAPSPADTVQGSAGGFSAQWGSAGEFLDGQWHHLLVQQRAGQFMAFFDGVPQQGTLAGTMPALADAAKLRLGGPAWQGILDSVRLHNAALDEAAVPSLVYAWTEVRPNVEVDYVAYYAFEGDARNDRGVGLHGVVHGARLASDRCGSPNSAYAFNGTTDFIEVPEAYTPPMRLDWALGFFCLSQSANVMTAVAVTPGLVSVDVVLNRGSAVSVHVDGEPVAGLEAGEPGALTDGKWHFVLVQQRGALVELHVDGVRRAARETRVPLAGVGSTFLFGKGSLAASAISLPWLGLLDDVQIHERSFSTEQIQRLSTLVFRPKDGAGLVAFRDRLWLLGGWNPNYSPTTSNSVWNSPDGLRWTLVTRAPWEGRHTSGWVVFNDRLWVVVGDRNSGHYQRDVWSSPDGVQWDLVTDQVPWSDRVTPTVMAFQGRLWAMGGTTVGEAPGEGAAFNDVYSSADGANWRLELTQAPWAPRGLILGGLVFAGRMWVAGGGRYDDGRTYLNDVWSSSDGVHWRQELAQAPWPGRQYHSVAVHHGKLWVVAGSLESQPAGSRDVWYSPDGQRWVELPDTPWDERHATAVASLRGRLWMTAGSNRSLYNDVWALDFA